MRYIFSQPSKSCFNHLKSLPVIPGHSAQDPSRMTKVATGIRLLIAGLFCFALIAGHTVLAQSVSFPVREQSSGITRATDLLANPGSGGNNPNVLTVQNDLRGPMAANPSSFATQVKYKSNNTLVKFGIDYSGTQLPTTRYVYKLMYKLEGHKTMADNVPGAPAIIDSLIISYKPDSLSPVQDLQVKAYPRYYDAKLTVLDIFDITPPSNPSNPPSLPVALSFPIGANAPTNFYIELGMQYQAFARQPSAPAQLGVNIIRNYNAGTQNAGPDLDNPNQPIPAKRAAGDVRGGVDVCGQLQGRWLGDECRGRKI